MEVCFAVQRGMSPELTSVESLVGSEADFRFQCTTSSVESLVRSEADFRFGCVTSSGRTSVGSLVRSEADSHFRLDDEGVGEKANHTASRTLISVMRLYRLYPCRR